MSELNILVIDDDVELCELLGEYLDTEGYKIEAVHNGAEGADKVIQNDYSLIILDVMLPGMGGFDVLQKIRSVKNTPVLMLTAKGDDIDKILGLEMGADDYLPKPYNPRELLARIKAILRRTEIKETSKISEDEIAIGQLVLNKNNLSGSFAGKDLNLTVVEFNMLNMLAEEAGKVVTREDIAETVLGRTLTPFDRSVDVHMSNIRKKLGNNDIIKSIRGVGYHLSAGK
jgi:two-component system response regulator CpxR